MTARDLIRKFNAPHASTRAGRGLASSGPVTSSRSGHLSRAPFGIEFRAAPRIVLLTCCFCHGKGSYQVRGREFRCVPCNGRGTVTTEGALA